jgi:hypothetical protein
MEQQGASISWFTYISKKRSSVMEASHPVIIPRLFFHFDKILLAFPIVPDGH